VNAIFKVISYVKNLEIDYSSNAIQPTFLYSKKCNVHEKNMEELEKNPNELLIFKALYTEIQNDYKLDKTDQLLYLKVGAQVMLNVNLDCEAGLVNGSRGIITGYSSENGGELKIKFLNGTEMFFKRHETSVEEDGKLLYKVVQFPFILAYALSIHKSQGMTLDAIEIDIGSKIFAAGQAYTALSRAQSLTSVKVKSISISSFIVNPDVLAFYKEVEEQVKITNNKFITKQLNKIIHNILTHTKLDESLDFLWDFIPEDEEELLKFFNNFSNEKINIELDQILESNDSDIKLLKNNVYEIKKFMINNIEDVRIKLKEFNLV
jgi:hypothetical protein